MGLAPFNAKVSIVNKLTRYSRVILHSSWPYWTTEHCPHPPKSENVTRNWQHFLKNRISQATFVTNAARTSFAALASTQYPKYVVGHSFDAEIFNNNPGETVRRPRSYLYVGRLEESKGITAFLRLVAEIPEGHYTIVGSGPLDKLIMEQQHKYSDRLRYLGYIKDQRLLAQIYREHEYLLLPAQRTPKWEELFGIAIIEAMACGTIPITTDHTGPREIFSDSYSQLTIPEEHYTERAKALLQRYADHPYERTALSLALTHHAKKYTTENVSAIWEKIFDIQESNRK